MNDSQTGPDTSGTLDRQAKISRSLLSTVPIVLAGSMAVSLGMTGPVFASERSPEPERRPHTAPDPEVAAGEQRARTVQAASATEVPERDERSTFAAAPSSYTVVSGDTVATIAGRFGLSTASVLALNGLSWKSTIFPGQALRLTAAAPAPAPRATTAPRTTSSGTYTIVRGDTLSSIAGRHGVTTQQLIQANGLTFSSIIYPGQKLTLPGGSATTAPSTPRTAAPTSTPPAGSYKISTGDTLSTIASRTGTSVQALMAANGLSWTSTIYAGRTLRLPGATTAAVGVPRVVLAEGTRPAPFVTTSTLTHEQQGNARTIIRVGRSLGISDRGIVIALAAAAQESSLRNIDYGDRDSLGLFQQRPSTGWGSAAQLTDPVHATKLFFGGPSNPNKGKTRGLLDVRGWTGMSVTVAAQAVQISAYPDAYAKWEGPAKTWLAQLG